MNVDAGKRMRRTVGVAAAAAVAVAVGAGACTSGGWRAQEPEEREPAFRLAGALAAFTACEELQAYLRTEGARVVGPYGLGGGDADGDRGFPMPLLLTDDRAVAGGAAAQENAAPPAPVAGEDYSGTNVQEKGVDEPDIVKTDGRRLVAMAGGRLRLVDLTGERPAMAATLAISGEHQQAELLLAGDRVLVLHESEPQPDPEPVPQKAVPELLPRPARAQVTVVDISDPGALRVAAQVKLDGHIVTARMTDGVARLVLRSGPPRIGFSQPSGREEDVARATAANREAVARSTVQDWLPTYAYAEPDRPGAAASGPLVGCDEVARPKEFSGLDMVSVLTLDAADPRPGPAATVLGAGELVYASAGSLYVTTSRWSGPVPLQDAERTGTTEIHKFGIADKVRTRYLASGSVPGRLLNQFSMSEHSGHLRVATTTDGISEGRDEPGASESSVIVLREDGERLVTVGSVTGLGKGERIHAVRFIGDLGYVVTFRRTDPLYVVDLSDPARPAVKGELKIPGYSAYLHPAGEDRLIGVGQEATGQGRSVGTQISLFDVSDPASPRRLAQQVLPGSDSEAEVDHHAFLYWARTGLALIPVQTYADLAVDGPVEPKLTAPGPRESFVGAVGFGVSEADVRELGRVRHRGDTPIRRSVVVGDAVLTLSERGLLASDLDDLRERSWLAF